MNTELVVAQDLDIVFHNPSVEKILHYEELLGERPQVDLLTTHVLSGGIYARTIIIPPGVSLVGATHNRDHINILQGDITVTTDVGMKRLVGHHVLPTKAGMKRIGYAHSETVWTTLVYTTETELDKIEDEITPESNKLQTRTLTLPEMSLERLEIM
jgi:hypothetical protein